MDIMSNISFGRDITDYDLNDLYKSYHDGIYTFEINDAKLIKNYPVEKSSGFLTINTNFDSTLCTQKIVTFKQNHFFRLGKLVNDVMTWSKWDRYATILDIPANTNTEIDEIYVNKEDFFPLIDSEVIDRNKGGGNLFTTTISSVKDELRSVYSNIYKRYGNITHTDTITTIMDSKNTKSIDGTYVHKNFLLGYWIKGDKTPSTSPIGGLFLPSREAGILQAFSSLIENDGGEQSIGKRVIGDKLVKGDDRRCVLTTWVFTEFITGDMYVTQSLNGSYYDLAHYERDILSKVRNDMFVYPTTDFHWSKYSFNHTRTFNLNKVSIENREMLLRAKYPYLYTSIPTGNIEAIRNGNTVNTHYFSETISWVDDRNVNLINNNNGTPITNQNQFSVISDLIFNGTGWFKNGKVSSYPNKTPFKIWSNEVVSDDILMTLYNTFRYSYSILEIRRHSSTLIEKAGT